MKAKLSSISLVATALMISMAWPCQADVDLHPDRIAAMKPAVDMPWAEKAQQIQDLYAADPMNPMFRKIAPKIAPPGPVYSSGEFEAVDEVILSWQWFNGDGVDVMYREMVDAIVDAGVTPRIVAENNSKKNAITSFLAAGGVPTGGIAWNIYNYNAIWVRDYGPFPLFNEMGATAWADANYYPERPLDDQLPIWLAGQLGYPLYHFNLSYEGGNFANNGDGLCLASDTVLYYNPAYNEAELEDLFGTYLGCEDIVLLEPMDDDGTGHIDMSTIWIDRDTIIVADYDTSQHASNAAILDANAALLDGYPLPGGGTLEVVRIPMPDPHPQYLRTYTNGLHVNGIYMLPVYSASADKQAETIAILEAQLPGWEIRPINADAIIPWYGAIHCITQVNRHVEIPCWDDDGDGYDDEICGGTDCDDADAAVNPGMAEIVGNGIDDNCNGQVDEQETCFIDTAL